ncbi:MAG TPA: hypothetical protein VK995_04960 [Oceanipulchritudo sp.]|nr:hypothetical protein [Oceanipulchritudo sp.]
MIDKYSPARLSAKVELPVIATLSVLLWFSLILAKIQDWPYTDPRGSLLSAQAMVENGSFDLTPYDEAVKVLYWQKNKTEKGIYYNYPYGTTILHLPAVWFVNKLGVDLANIRTEARFNRVFAAWSVVLVFLLTYLIGRRYNSFPITLFLALTITLGTGVYSTLGMALWNLNYAVVIALAVLLLFHLPEIMKRADTGWLLGILLFLGFAIRPSFALFILMVFSYLGWKHPAQLFRSAIVSALLLGLYLLFSFNTFGKILPGHYEMSAFNQGSSIIINFLGHLISPSRGLLLFSPHLLVLLFCLIKYKHLWKQQPLLIFVSVWMLSLLLMLSTWYMWWGGGGFGNRLLTELTPGIVLLVMVFVGALFRCENRIRRKVSQGLFAVLALFSTWVHVVQGANNQSTVTWFNQPNKDANPQYFWNPRFPQFLASKEQIDRMLAWEKARTQQNFGTLIKSYQVTDEELEFGGWYRVEISDVASVWSRERTASIRIPFPWQRSAQAPPGVPQGLDFQGGTYTIAINGITYKGQTFFVRINGEKVGEVRTTDKTSYMTYYLDPITLSSGQPIELVFEFMNPRTPAVEEPNTSKDPRPLGFQLRQLQIYWKD